MILWLLARKIFGWAAIAAGVICLFYWLYSKPENWNAPARGYLAHVGTLTRDSTALSDTLVVRNKTIAKLDTVIRDLTKEASDAITFGLQWKDKFATQVMVSDATADHLTAKETELALYKAFQANGTLRTNVGNLTPSTPEVLTAGLKTANREALQALALDTLSNTVGRFAVANRRLSNGLSSASAGFAKLGEQARAKAKGGVWPFNVRRKRELREFAVKSDSNGQATSKVKIKTDSLFTAQESELERISNRKQ